MRIAVFDDLTDGGARRVVYEQLKWLATKHSLLYVTNEIESRFDFGRVADVVKRFDLSLNEHSGVMRPVQELSLLTWLVPQYWQVAAQIAEFGAEVALVHPSRLTQAPMLLFFLRVPSVYYAEEWFRLVYEKELFSAAGSGLKAKYEAGRRKGLAAVDWAAVKRANRVVVNSAFTQSNFARAYGVEADLIYPGVDGKVFYPANQTQKGYFLFVGEKERINGADLVEQVIQRSPIPFKVRYVTFERGAFRYSQAELNTLYQQAVATLCLSYNEPFGLSAIESMAAGTPVIAVNEGGYTETVRDTETGLLIERDAEALYRAMKLMAVETEKRRVWGKKAREWVERQFSWQQHGRQLESILKEVVG